MVADVETIGRPTLALLIDGSPKQLREQQALFLVLGTDVHHQEMRLVGKVRSPAPPLFDFRVRHWMTPRMYCSVKGWARLEMAVLSMHQEQAYSGYERRL